MSEAGKIARILVAEGNRDTRSAMVWCLFSEGFWVHPVSNGFDAALALEPPGELDFAIIDLALRGCDGRRIIEGMRSSECLKRIPIVATGLMESFAPLPRDVYFMQKPCDFELLVNVIRALGRGNLSSCFRSRGGRAATSFLPVTQSHRQWLHRFRR